MIVIRGVNLGSSLWVAPVWTQTQLVKIRLVSLTSQVWDQWGHAELVKVVKFDKKLKIIYTILKY